MIVLWRVATRCNLACGFCAYDRRLPLPRSMVASAEALRLIDLLGAWRQRSDRRVLLSWLGGEPLLWRDRADCDAAARAAGLELSLTSNGTGLQQRAVRVQLLQHYSELTISIDGEAFAHDRLRGATGSWSRIVAGLHRLALERLQFGSALKIRINSVLMRSNIAGYPALLRQLAELGLSIDEFSFNALGGRDRPEFFREQALLPEQWSAFTDQLPGLRAELQQRGIRLLGETRYLERLAASISGEAWPVADCSPGEEFLFIDETGRVSPCSFTSAQYSVGLSELQSVDDLLKLPQRFRELRRAHPATICADCPSTQVFGKFDLAHLPIESIPANADRSCRAH